MEKREKRGNFTGQIGFVLAAAGSAVGLGNIWRFPYITGKYGGASFVLLYMVFLVILGLPIVVMEFAVGRASQRSTALSFPAGAGGDKMALVQVRHHHRELSADDVLYRHQRLAVLLLY